MNLKQRNNKGGQDELQGKQQDPRWPIYIGLWKRSIPYVDEDIAKDDLDEPHIKRRHAILKQHPEITQLYGVEPLTKYVIAASVALQLLMAYTMGRIWTSSTVALVVSSFVIGGSFAQMYGVVIHEATHGLVFKTPVLNRLAGLVANVGLPFPIAASFRRYHLEHHAFQGVVGKDPDLPLAFEVQLIRGNPFMKLLFLFCYPVMYVVRGLALQKAPSTWELINWAFTICTDIVVWHVCGPRGFLYMILSLWFGYGIHPAAAHFIQEHFTFDNGQETYSYYGGLNKLFLNIGYHNEHHDFTKVPWTKLPTVKAIAPEFYECLMSHQSWLMVHWNFVFDRTLGPQSRVARDYDDHKRGRRMLNPKNNIVDEVKYWEDGEGNLQRCDSGIHDST